MPLLTQCASATISGISRPTLCNIIGGLSTAYIARVSDLDLTAMSLPLNFDPVNRKVLNFVMNAAATFKTLQLDGDPSSMAGERATNGIWTHTLTSYFEGHDCARDLALENMASACGLVMVVETNNCGDHIIIGLEWTGTTLRQTAIGKGLKMDTASYTFGLIDGDSPSDTVTFVYKSTQKPLCIATTAVVPYV